ncbi:MAG: SDR family NAD(P)-dependent oxidoreductase [Acidimicrobiia bacterium]
MTPLAVRRFDAADQEAFADLSGDRNPLHLDELAARRSLFGERVVHGLHVVLWAVDAYLASRSPDRPGLEGVTVNFAKPVFLGDEVQARVAKETAELARLRVEVDGVLLVDIRLALGASPRPVAPPRPAADGVGPEPAGGAAVERTLDDLAGLAGELAVGPVAAGPRFPALAEAVGDAVVARLVALTRLVGMECPGLHSLFAGFEVRVEPGTGPGPLRWAVARVDDRYGAVAIDVDAGCLAGEVRAFMRPAPARQLGAAALAGLDLGLGGLDDVRALVVGGSRGLGELAAKLLAAGGAEVVLTWHRGRADALRVVEDIIASGGRARAVQLDVGDPEPALQALAGDGFVVSHLYYFSSPRIFARRTRLFHHELLEGFLHHYVTGFVRSIEAARRAGAEPLVAYYPSSVAVDEQLPELTEYIVAKVAGERAAEVLGAQEPWLETIVQRLPRLPTDQTATIGAVAAADPVRIMADMVRRSTTG